jgi:hypothetical protein
MYIPGDAVKDEISFTLIYKLSIGGFSVMKDYETTSY